MNYNKIDAMSEIIYNIYHTAQLKILQDIARRVAKGAPEAEWQRRKLAELEALMKDAREILDDAELQANSDIGRDMQKAYIMGYSDIGIEKIDKAVGLAGITVDQRKVAALAEELLNIRNGALLGTNATFRQVITESTTLMATGAYTRKQATQEALIRFAANGISGFRDKAGRRWSMEAYARMATRTSYVRANLSGTLDRMNEFGYDKVIVSDHPGESALCRPWENKVLIADRPNW